MSFWHQTSMYVTSIHNYNITIFSSKLGSLQVCSTVNGNVIGTVKCAERLFTEHVCLGISSNTPQKRWIVSNFSSSSLSQKGSVFYVLNVVHKRWFEKQFFYPVYLFCWWCNLKEVFFYKEFVCAGCYVRLLRRFLVYRIIWKVPIKIACVLG